MHPLITTLNNTTTQQAVECLTAGKLVCFPTETVYALAADSRNDQAIASIYAAKERNLTTPIALLVENIAQAQEIALFDARAEKLAARFFPGPLTLVLPIKAGAPLSPLLNPGRTTIAIRIPDHPVALAILQAFGHPIAATSTNISGQASAISAYNIDSSIKKHIALIVDGGISRLQTASTIIDLSSENLQMLREGSISYEDIMDCLK